jgi:hypothetical protein
METIARPNSGICEGALAYPFIRKPPPSAFEDGN